MMDRIERIRQSFIMRKPEESDTHDYIKRHDPDYNKNKPKHHDDEDVTDRDMADISVESLIIFLQGLKKDTDSLPKTSDQSVDQSMKKAITAYGAQKPDVQKRYTYLDDEDQHVDLEMVDRLIAALKSLLDKGIDHITLVNAEGFLQSIEKTVEKLQSL